ITQINIGSVQTETMTSSRIRNPTPACDTWCRNGRGKQAQPQLCTASEKVHADFGIPPLVDRIQDLMTIPTAASATRVPIGKDLVVNRLGFGAMRLTGPGIWGDPKDPAEARRVLRRLPDLNVNFIDTADSYGPEVSENLIAEALRPYPPGLVIATKGGF